MFVAELPKWNAIDVRNPKGFFMAIVVNRKRAFTALAEKPL
jgi:hypothetical protein